MNILVTNDDGVHAEGLALLETSVAPLGDVVVVAPETEQSASSHALTLRDPLRVRRHSPSKFSVSGTPTDCVLLAMNGLTEKRPEIVLSGINHGANMGDDVNYSGTVAAAMEAALLGVPAIAFSLAGRAEWHLETAASFVPEIVRRMIAHPPPEKCLWNVNVPNIPVDQVRGIVVTRLGRRVYENSVVRKTDPRGRDYYWIGGGEPTWKDEPGTDFAAVNEGYVSLTPIRLDLNDFEAFAEMERWDWENGA